ncbi:hypothetical protein ABZ570_31215 [Micromonospora sp. NPDC007271]|uniref:hypothetical protein n=1 Tax=Micromonospora sp. NPDC007271 TaxID=3154587 RepID=UPI003404BC6C
MFRNLFNRGPRPVEPAVDVDRALDDLQLRAARTKAAGGDWRAARDVIEAAGADWERRGRRVSVLSDTAADDGTWLYDWLTATPDDPTANVLLAATLAEQAGRARGSAPASHTTQEQFQDFAELSAHAAAAARRAISLAPHDPTPWVGVLWAMFADGHSRQAEFHQAFTEALRRDPYNFGTHLAAVSFLCEKWYGSHQEMFGLARQAAAAAPPGTAVTMLPLFAHFEYAMREFNWGTPTPEGVLACRRYFQRPEVRQEYDACAAKWRGAGRPTHGDAMVCRNWLALAYALADRRAEAKAMFDEIGPYATSPVWSYFFGSIEHGFQHNRRWANAR